MLTHLRQFHHASWQHDFVGNGEYNVLRGVSKRCVSDVHTRAFRDGQWRATLLSVDNVGFQFYVRKCHHVCSCSRYVLVFFYRLL